jgi:chaperonin GroES
MIKPIGDRVLIQPTETPRTTPSGLHIPETVKDDDEVDRVRYGVVVAVGVLVPSYSPEVGDRVAYNARAGYQTEQNGARFVILEQEDVLAVVD